MYRLPQIFLLLSFLQGILFSPLLNSLLKLVLLCSLPSSLYRSATCKMHFPFPFCLYFTFSSLTTALQWLRRKGACCLFYRRDLHSPTYSLLVFITAWWYWVIASYKPLRVANLTVKLHIPPTELFFQTIVLIYQDLFEFHSCSRKCLLPFPIWWCTKWEELSTTHTL